MKRVVVFGLGGTISMTADSGGGVVPALSAGQLVAGVPGLAGSGVAVDVIDFRRIPGASLSFEDVSELAAAIDERLAGGADGVVVTQGTDTIEEVAYLLDLTHARQEPVVVTGAMRNPTLAGADGPANILAAIQTAAAETARGLGALVVFADEVHAAARVRKTHSTSGHTFQSANGGPLGCVVEGEPRIINQPRTRVTLPPAIGGTAEVPVIPTVLGDTGMALRAVGEYADGLVVAAFGAGHVPGAVVDVLGDLAGRIPVVLASRGGAGSTLARTYAFPGSEKDMLGRGLVPAGFLDPVKARLLLRHLLVTGHDRAGIHAVFEQAGR
ncbi:asparaginase [Kibdelosporangium phytohabitans]|uniref:Asparaginase n=1 Tax=Kibdelosporangium phytohabitans TaxID=860235 RepID=A0A0N9I3B2_9PSEU|nr:asparaginase [Kibdelosporangium phytohabitans]ALG08745.1 asparaginase [Kibdelosporangium phytohabitans]MBE1470138.1 L-asparaginase [Kibdelosporangium phytohabitans]